MEVVWYQGWYKSAFVYPPRLHKKTWCSFKYWNEFQIILVGLVYCSGGFGAPFWYLAVLLPCSFLSFCPLSGLYPLAHTSPNCTTCCALTSHTWVHLNMTGIFPQLLKPPQAISSKIRELWTQKTELTISLIEALSRLTKQNWTLQVSAPQWF